VGQTQTLYLDQGSFKPNRVFQVKSGLIGEVARLPERIMTMRRTVAVVGTAIFFVFVPCVLAGLVPWWISRWEFRLSFIGVELTRFVAAALILAGVAGLVDSFVRFALQGLGTPAPIAPTQHLSLCAQSNVRGGRRRHFRPGGPVRRLAAVCLRCGPLARLPPVCRGLRRADAQKVIRGGIRSVPHQCATLDPALDRVARRSVAAKAYDLGAKFVGNWPFCMDRPRVASQK